MFRCAFISLLPKEFPTGTTKLYCVVLFVRQGLSEHILTLQAGTPRHSKSYERNLRESISFTTGSSRTHVNLMIRTSRTHINSYDRDIQDTSVLRKGKERKHWALRPQKPLRLIRDGDVGGSGFLYLPPTRYTVTTRMILH